MEAKAGERRWLVLSNARGPAAGMAWVPQMETGTVGGQTAPGGLAYPAGKERAGKGLLRWWGSTSKVATVTTRSD